MTHLFSRPRRTALICTIVFFILGLSFGILRSKNQIRTIAKSQPLRILCPADWFSPEILDDFSKKYSTRIEQYTYQTPAEFLKQMANSDGRIDVICTSSWLIQSLNQNHWLAKIDPSKLPNIQNIAVDFRQLPFDPTDELSVPLYWNVYGLLSKQKVGDNKEQNVTLKSLFAGSRVSVWGEPLNLTQFDQKTIRILNPVARDFSAEATFAQSEWVQIPLGVVARLLGKESPYQFVLPTDGAAVDVGVFAVGSRADQPKLALKLIDASIGLENALYVHDKLNTGLVHKGFENSPVVAEWHKAQSLRNFPLTRLRFPQISIETLTGNPAQDM